MKRLVAEYVISSSVSSSLLILAANVSFTVSLTVNFTMVNKLDFHRFNGIFRPVFDLYNTISLLRRLAAVLAGFYCFIGQLIHIVIKSGLRRLEAVIFSYSAAGLRLLWFFLEVIEHRLVFKRYFVACSSVSVLQYHRFNVSRVFLLLFRGVKTVAARSL